MTGPSEAGAPHSLRAALCGVSCWRLRDKDALIHLLCRRWRAAGQDGPAHTRAQQADHRHCSSQPRDRGHRRDGVGQDDADCPGAARPPRRPSLRCSAPAAGPCADPLVTLAPAAQLLDEAGYADRGRIAVTQPRRVVRGPAELPHPGAAAPSTLSLDSSLRAAGRRVCGAARGGGDGVRGGPGGRLRGALRGAHVAQHAHHLPHRRVAAPPEWLPVRHATSSSVPVSQGAAGSLLLAQCSPVMRREALRC